MSVLSSVRDTKYLQEGLNLRQLRYFKEIECLKSLVARVRFP